MEAIIELIQDNPIYGVGLGVLLLLFLFALFKKMFKILIIAIILNLAYVYYLHDMAGDVISKGQSKAEQFIDKAKSLAK